MAKADYITNIQLSGLDKIQDFELDLSNNFYQFVVLTGDNGTGKTLLLQLILLALDDQTPVDNRVLEVWLNQYDKELKKYSYARTTEKALDRILEHNPYRKIAAYGASRLSIQKPESMEKNQLDLQHLLVSNTPLKNIEYWLKMKLLSDQKSLVDRVLELLASFMPNVSKISYQKDPKEGVVFQYKTIYGLETIKGLSAGNKGVLGLIGDLLIRLWDSQLEVQEIKDLRGIVFIDEIEAHLHPEWQRKLPKLLMETFPNVQFIVSTHTPMTLLGLPSKSALIHIDGNEEGPTKVQRLELDIQNMTPQQILTSNLFGVESLRSLYNEKLEDLNTEEDYSTLMERKEVQERIKEKSKTFKFQKPEE